MKIGILVRCDLMPCIMLGVLETLIIKADMPMNGVSDAYDRVEVFAVAASGLLSEALELVKIKMPRVIM